MKFYEIRKQYLGDDFTTKDILIRSYSDKSYAENKCAIMNNTQDCLTTVYRVEEADHDYSTS